MIYKVKCDKIYLIIINIYEIMIFEFLKKQKEIKKKKDLIRIMIKSINISEDQKFLYLESLAVLDIEWITSLYKDLAFFIESVEVKELEEINKQNFSTIAWMNKKEAEEKKKELNSFSFLLHNL